MSVRLSVHYVFEDRTSKVDINFFPDNINLSLATGAPM